MLEFALKQPRPLGLAPAFGWYLLVYLPALGILALVEGSVRGWWGWTIADWEYEFGAYVALVAGAVAAGGLVAVPLHLLLVRALAAQASPLHFRLLASASALLLLALLAFGWMFLLTLPVSFVIAAAAFGQVSARHLSPLAAPPA